VGDELTSGEVAAMLGVSERSVLYAVDRGDLVATAIQKGKKRYWRFSKEHVEAYKSSISGQAAEDNV
jgi:excisionase family DNA binding protein